MDSTNNANITYRRTRRVKSLEDISMTSSNMGHNQSDHLFDITTLSIPNDSIHTDNEYSERIKSLTNELLSAHEEIANLNSENFRLKADLQNALKLIDTYKKICITPERKNMTPVHKQNKNTLPHKTLTFLNSTQCKQIGNNSLQQNAVLKHDNDSCYECSSLPPCNTSTKKSSSSQKKEFVQSATNVLPLQVLPTQKRRKIIILADQQGYRLRQCLQYLVGEKYIVKNYFKPGAQLYQIFAIAEREILTLDKNDFLVIVAGINDKEPNSMLFALQQLLANTCQTNVVFSEGPYKYLNECKFNYELTFACSKFPHCKYIDMDYYRFLPSRGSLVLYKCRSFLRDILNIDYKLQFDQHIEIKLHNPDHNLPLRIDKFTQTDTAIENINKVYTPKNSKEFFRAKPNKYSSPKY